MSREVVVNGRPCAFEAGPDVPLLYVLRNDLGLKGTRFGCGEGLCGACMVLVDGKPATSCNLPVSAVAGCEVTTVEGLPAGRLQQAFVDEGAGQCGFCLSGIVMSAFALLSRKPEPEDADIRAALEPHICRCGVQPRVIRAVRKAAQGL